MRSVSTLRRSRFAAIGLAALTVTAVACSSSSSSKSSSAAPSSSTGSSSATSAPAEGGATIASKLILGAAPECTTRPFCILGLKRVYGLTFKDFKPLDADGPLTYQAISSGQIDIAEIFSSDAQVLDKGLVVLTDDKHLENADNVVPIIRKDKATPAVLATVNAVSKALTTDELIGLNKKVIIDKADSKATADDWLKGKGLDKKSADATGTSITIGGFNFAESSTLAYLYGDALKAQGATVTVKDKLGSRETLEPGLQSGQIDMLLEYAAHALLFVDKSADASGDISGVVQKLTEKFTPLNLVVADPTTAVDTDAFAVTKATAAKYKLTTISDLAKPAP
ncbi:MAG: hypothetical protein NVS3B12_26750 [Acidimicrobiales bacterium]